jgi:type IV secretion system protein VirD4
MTPSATHAAPWTASRAIAAGCFVLIAGMALVAATLYLAAVLFLGLHRLDPRQATVSSFPGYWKSYSRFPGERRLLVISIGLPGLGLLVALPAGLLLSTRRRRPLHGEARFASPSEVAASGLLVEPQAGTPRILVGKHRGRYLGLPGQLSVMLSAPTRSGKGVGVVIPNLLNWPDSVVVLDIKGENYAATAGYRAAHGQAVYAFSPFDAVGRSHRWNPLSAVRTDPMHRVSDLLTIGQVFFPNDGSGTSSEAFFNDQARNLFMGLGLMLLETPALPRTLGEMLRQSSGKGQSLRDHLQLTIRTRQQSDKPLSDECVDALQRLIANSENTLSSIVATFNAPLTIFADAVVDAATSADDFRLDAVRCQRLSIYVRIPPNRLPTARPLLSLFFSQLVSLNTQTLPEQDPTLRHQCLLVNDEFAAMGRVSIITHAAAFLAGYNLRLLTVVQAMSQLDALYGDKEARTFATNHGLQILFAPREQRDADEYSAMLGHFTERAISRGRSHPVGSRGSGSISRNESDQRRALLLPQEFKELGRDRLVLITESNKPILGEKIRYFEDEAFRARLLAAPEVPAMDIALHLARVQQRWREAPDELPEGEVLRIEDLAHDVSALPDHFEGSPEQIADVMLRFFGEATPEGGSVAPEPDEHGVIAESESTESRPRRARKTRHTAPPTPAAASADQLRRA